MRLLGSTGSHVGNVREANQDRAFFDGQVAAVADGMGGHQGGERAAELAIGQFEDHLPALTETGLVDLVRSANLEVHGHAADNDLPGMGTTLVALALHDNGSITVANVGDSRAYWIRDGFMRQITEDHSFVEDLVRQGRLSPQEAAIHPQRNILTRAVGISVDIEVDQFPVQDPEIGDRFLLCSDGLFNELTEDEILGIVSAPGDPSEAAEALVEAALATPCRDNVTVAVVEVVADDDPRLASVVTDGRLVTEDGVITDEYLDQGGLTDTAPSALAPPGSTDGPESVTDGGGDHDGARSESESESEFDVDTPDATSPVPDPVPDPSSDPDSDPATPAAVTTAEFDIESVASGDGEGGSYGAAGEEARSEPRSRGVVALAATLLVVGLLAVSGAVGFSVTRSYAQSGYFIAEDAATGELTVFQGRRGGFLGFQPSPVETATSPDQALLTDRERQIVDEETFETADEAFRVLDQIDERISADRDSFPESSDSSGSSGSVDQAGNSEGANPSDGSEGSEGSATDSVGGLTGAVGNAGATGIVEGPAGSPSGPVEAGGDQAETSVASRLAFTDGTSDADDEG